MFKIQLGKYGSGWEDTEDIDGNQAFDTLADAVAALADMETFGKYHYRVVDEHGTVLHTKTIPYEGISINKADKNYAWLQDIMADYGISKEETFQAILHWLKIHTTPNGI